MVPIAVLALVAGCGPSYSPDTYSSNAVQQANKVEQGLVVGVRKVGVDAAGTVGAVTGAAAGGIAGSQTPGGVGSALGALGGTLVGGIIGSSVERAQGDMFAFEYVVRKPNGELISVTQKDPAPLPLGQKVLVIAGAQARIVPDYTVPPAPATTAQAPASPPPAPPALPPAALSPEPAPPSPVPQGTPATAPGS